MGYGACLKLSDWDGFQTDSRLVYRAMWLLQMQVCKIVPVQDCGI